MTTDLTTLLKELLARLFSDPEAARQFAQDPQGTLAARGISDHDLSAVNMPAVVEQVTATTPLPHEARHELQTWATQEAAYHEPVHHASSHHESFGSGGHHQALDHIISQVTRVQEIVHNETYQSSYYYSSDDHSTHIDNSIDVNGDHNYIDSDPTTAIGDHPVAVGGDLNGPVNTGAGGVVTGGDIDGPTATGPGSVAIDGPVSAPVNTGINTGIIADGPVSDTVVGDHNTAVHTGNLDHSPLGFGSGDVTSVDLHGSHFGQGATVGVGGSTHGGSITEDSGNITNSGNTSNSNNHSDSHDRTDSHDKYNSDNDYDSHDRVDVDSHDKYDSDNDSHDHYKTDSHDHVDSDNDTHVDSHDDVDIH